MKKCSFGKLTQAATVRALAKELKVKSSQISLWESGYSEKDQMLFGSDTPNSPAPIWTVTFEVQIPFGTKTLSVIGGGSVMIFDTERVEVVTIEYDRTDVITCREVR